MIDPKAYFSLISRWKHDFVSASYAIGRGWVLTSGITLVILPAMKTAISIPDPVFRSAEQLAHRLGVSRSELYSKAVAELINKHRHDLITSRLNEIYAEGEDSSLEEEIALLQHRSLTRKRR